MIPLRLWLLGGAVAAFVALGLYARHEHDRAVREAQRAKAETMRADLAGLTTQTVEKFHTETRTIVKQGEREVQFVQSIPGADAPLDPAIRSGLCDALGRMRDNPGACPADGPGDPSPALRPRPD